MERGAMVLLVLGAACGMELRETVERMVVLRTTGSDLTPAATGFIYKKESDGPASVVKMGESEVMEHLSKLYEQPKTFAAPLPVAAGPFYTKEAKEDETAASFSSETKVIPILEKQEEDDENSIDGIADEDYGKILGEYASEFGDYKSELDKYLKSLGHFEDGIYHDTGDAADYDSNNRKENSDTLENGYGNKHQYENADGGKYHSEKYESFHISEGQGDKKEFGDADSYGQKYADQLQYKGEDEDGNKARYTTIGDNSNGFRQFFGKNGQANDQDFYDGGAIRNGFHKIIDGYSDSGSDPESSQGDAYGSGHSEHGFGDDSDFKKEAGEGADKSNHQYSRGFASSRGLAGNSFGYEVKH